MDNTVTLFDAIFTVARTAAQQALLTIDDITSALPHPLSAEATILAIALFENALDNSPEGRKRINDYKIALEKDKTRGQETIH